VGYAYVGGSTGDAAIVLQSGGGHVVNFCKIGVDPNSASSHQFANVANMNTTNTFNCTINGNVMNYATAVCSSLHPAVSPSYSIALNHMNAVGNVL
jgi:hypothetical protein